MQYFFHLWVEGRLARFNSRRSKSVSVAAQEMGDYSSWGVFCILQNIFPPEFEISHFLGWIKSPRRNMYSIHKHTCNHCFYFQNSTLSRIPCPTRTSPRVNRSREGKPKQLPFLSELARWSIMLADKISLFWAAVHNKQGTLSFYLDTGSCIFKYFHYFSGKYVLRCMCIYDAPGFALFSLRASCVPFCQRFPCFVLSKFPVFHFEMQGTQKVKAFQNASQQSRDGIKISQTCVYV